MVSFLSHRRRGGWCEGSTTGSCGDSSSSREIFYKKSCERGCSSMDLQTFVERYVNLRFKILVRTFYYLSLKICWTLNEFYNLSLGLMTKIWWRFNEWRSLNRFPIWITPMPLWRSLNQGNPSMTTMINFASFGTKLTFLIQLGHAQRMLSNMLPSEMNFASMNS